MLDNHCWQFLLSTSAAFTKGKIYSSSWTKHSEMTVGMTVSPTHGTGLCEVNVCCQSSWITIKILKKFAIICWSMTTKHHLHVFQCPWVVLTVLLRCCKIKSKLETMNVTKGVHPRLGRLPRVKLFMQTQVRKAHPFPDPTHLHSMWDDFLFLLTGKQILFIRQNINNHITLKES